MSRDDGQSEACQVVERRVIKPGRPRRIVSIAGRDEDDHSLARAGEEHAVRVEEVALIVETLHSRPATAPKIVKTPAAVVEAEIGIPRHAGPIEFQTLHL